MPQKEAAPQPPSSSDKIGEAAPIGTWSEEKEDVDPIARGSTRSKPGTARAFVEHCNCTLEPNRFPLRNGSPTGDAGTLARFRGPIRIWVTKLRPVEVRSVQGCR